MLATTALKAHIECVTVHQATSVNLEQRIILIHHAQPANLEPSQEVLLQATALTAQPATTAWRRLLSQSLAQLVLSQLELPMQPTQPRVATPARHAQLATSAPTKPCQQHTSAVKVTTRRRAHKSARSVRQAMFVLERLRLPLHTS